RRQVGQVRAGLLPVGPVARPGGPRPIPAAVHQPFGRGNATSFGPRLPGKRATGSGPLSKAVRTCGRLPSSASSVGEPIPWGRPLILVNGHSYWPVGADSAQVRQVGRVLDRVKALEPGTSVIACGDFNATPGSGAITLMRQTFASAHQARHGREPDFTCPTPL